MLCVFVFNLVLGFIVVDVSTSTCNSEELSVEKAISLPPTPYTSELTK